MEAVQAAVESHYHSPMVEKLRGAGGVMKFGDVTVRLAKHWFLLGVERAIDHILREGLRLLRLHLVGDHPQPEVNAQLAAMGIRTHWKGGGHGDRLPGPEDVVIIPAFGAEVSVQELSRSWDARSSTHPR